MGYVVHIYETIEKCQVPREIEGEKNYKYQEIINLTVTKNNIFISNKYLIFRTPI